MDPPSENDTSPTVKAYVHKICTKSTTESLRPKRIFRSRYAAVGHLSSG